MLIIRRRVGESILIGEEIEVQITEIAGNRVKIGIAAPSSVLILRKEIRLAEQENLAAARGVSPEAVHLLLRHFRPT